MPRPLIYSNGSFFVGVDDRCRIRDLFYPQVGLYNHLSGHAIRMGVWVDGAFSWIDEDGWNRDLSYLPGCLVGRIHLEHPAFGVELECTESINPDHNIFNREIEFRSTFGEEREVKLFFTHDLRLAETDIGDTAFYAPKLSGIVHYKGPHWFLFRCLGKDPEYATGIKGFAGFEGTWRDAEDGRLSMNPIAQGSVDSTLGVTLELDAEGHASATYSIFAAEDMDGLGEVSHHSGTSSFTYDSLEPNGNHEPPVPAPAKEEPNPLEWLLSPLPDDIFELCRKCLLIVEAHCDRHGAIIAAADSDIMTTNRANYCYCWPRDGAHICMVLDRIGRHELTRPFFRFCSRILSEQLGVLLQKYRPDETLGASWHPWVYDGRPQIPFQEDESASVVHALGEHFKIVEDLVLLEELYESLVSPLADFLMRHQANLVRMPLPSYDLWEERRGVHLYTACAVVAGLRSAAEMANRVSDPRAFDFQVAANEMRDAILEHFYDLQDRLYFRTISSNEPGDRTADASTLFLGLFGILDVADPLFERHMERVKHKLLVQTEVGGLARYENDYYFRVTEELPGNPWIITTMWLAQCQIARAKSQADLEEPLEWLRWALRHSGTTHVLPEQLHPYEGTPLSVSPLAWSHAEVLKTALDWADKRRAL